MSTATAEKPRTTRKTGNGQAELFTISGGPTTVEEGNYDHLIPELGGYEETQAFQDIEEILDSGCNLMLIGAPGAGKTRATFHYAAKKQMPLFYVNHDAQIESEQLMAKIARTDDGEWKLSLGLLALAYPRRALYVGDEFSMTRPSVNAMYHAALNGDPLPLKAAADARFVTKHSENRIILCCNGDGYAGNYEISEALGDRVVVYPWPYLDANKEEELLAPLVPDKYKNVLADLVTVANATRTDAAGSPDQRLFVITHRKLQQTCKLLNAGMDMKKAVRLAIINSAIALYDKNQAKALVTQFAGQGIDVEPVH